MQDCPAYNISLFHYTLSTLTAIFQVNLR